MFNIRRFVVYAIRTPRAGSESLHEGCAPGSVVGGCQPSPYRYPHSGILLSEVDLAHLIHSRDAGIAAAIALLLGIVGLYGVIAYSASQRTREIGIRIALGAQRNTITSMFVRQGLLLAGSGIVCGLLLALAATRLLRPCSSRSAPWIR